MNELQLKYIESRRSFMQKDKCYLSPVFKSFTYEPFPPAKLNLCNFKKRLNPVKFIGNCVDKEKSHIYTICEEKLILVNSVVSMFKVIPDSYIHNIAYKLEVITQTDCKLKPNAKISKVIDNLKKEPSLYYVINLAKLFKLSVLLIDDIVSILYNFKTPEGATVTDYFILYSKERIFVCHLNEFKDRCTAKFNLNGTI